jgi:serine/threonine protein kinase
MAATFEFLNRLGSGFFGEVWKVKDTGLDSIYALKLVLPEKVINPDNFYQEAQVLKAAEHPNIVHVFETGQLADNRIYVKMEFLKNGSLEDEASGSYVAFTRTKKLMIDLLRGLEHAHSKGIVHRDIKPANILIGDSKEGKLSDFGLALPELSKVNVSTLKKYQYWMHLAPEVDKISDYTFLSDIYSCGITLYRLVNGDSYLPSLPISELRLLAKNGKFPDRKKYRDFVPLGLKKLINKALSIDPKARFQSAEKMRHALEQVGMKINWTENTVTNGIRWRASLNNQVFQLLKTENSNKTWNIEFKKGSSRSTLRRVNKWCLKNISKDEAERTSKKLLQDFVTGRED